MPCLTMPKIMGVINVTPDSFYTDSQAHDINTAVKKAHQMVTEGVDILDIGGEATSPHLNVTQTQVSVEEELDRVVPIVEAIRQRFDVTLSVDTSKPQVMQAAVAAGANMINDQRALRLDGALEMATTLNVPICLMQMYGLQRKVNQQTYSETLQEITQFLLQRVEACIQAGIKKQHIIIDPGVGGGNFGKSASENLYLINHLNQFVDTGFPVLIGMSRKSFIGDTLNISPQERLYGGLGLAVLATLRGAAILRTHDILPTIQAVKMVQTASELQ